MTYIYIYIYIYIHIYIYIYTQYIFRSLRWQPNCPISAADGRLRGRLQEVDEPAAS